MVVIYIPFGGNEEYPFGRDDRPEVDPRRDRPDEYDFPVPDLIPVEPFDPRKYENPPPLPGTNIPIPPRIRKGPNRPN